MTSGSGTCTATATQAADNNYLSGNTSGTTTAVQASQTITFTTPAPASAEYGSTFTVAATGGGSGNAVVFTSSGACTNSGATYTVTASSGTCSVIANQAGNPNYAAAAQVTETVSATPANGSVSVASSLNPSTSGQSVTFTATIGSDTGLVKGRKVVAQTTGKGSVTWSSNTGCGTTAVTTGNPGTATCTTTSLPVGTDTITATYSGDSNHNGATGTLSGGQVVSAGQTSSSTAVVSSLDPSTYGQAVSFAATVTAASGTPTGTVQFSVDGGAFGAPAALVAGIGVLGEHLDAGGGYTHGHGGVLRGCKFPRQHRRTRRRTSCQFGDVGHGGYEQRQSIHLRSIGDVYGDDQRPEWLGQRPEADGRQRIGDVEREHRLRGIGGVGQSGNRDMHHVEIGRGQRHGHGVLLG